jgi:hypothetical protein
MRRAQLQGEPSGLRLRVPLAGMPTRHGIHKSGQVPLPAWASADLPPSQWTLPTPSFDGDRQRELAHLLASLKPLPNSDSENPIPAMERVVNGTHEGHGDESLTEAQISLLVPEFHRVAMQAARRQAALQRARAHLHTVAYGDIGTRTGIPDDMSGVNSEAEPTSAAPPSHAPLASSQPAQSYPPPEGHNRYAALRLKLRGAPPTVVRPPAPEEGAHGAADGQTSTDAAGKSATAAAAAAALAARGQQGGGGNAAGKSAAARRAAAQQQQKAAQAARDREELGEAAGYTSLRIRPNSAINPRQFWSAVDEYMRPLPQQPPLRAPLPLPLPDRTPITDRLMAALLPVPPSAEEGTTACANGSAPVGGPPLSAPANGSGSASAAASRGSTSPEGLEARLRHTLVRLGLLSGNEQALALQPDEVGDELRAVQAELLPVARDNARTLDQIHRKASAMLAGTQRERIRLAALAKQQQKQQRQRQKQQQHHQANQPPRAPKRKKHGNESSGGGSTAVTNAANRGAAENGTDMMVVG